MSNRDLSCEHIWIPDTFKIRRTSRRADATRYRCAKCGAYGDPRRIWKKRIEEATDEQKQR